MASFEQLPPDLSPIPSFVPLRWAGYAKTDSEVRAMSAPMNHLLGFTTSHAVRGLCALALATITPFLGACDSPTSDPVQPTHDEAAASSESNELRSSPHLATEAVPEDRASRLRAHTDQALEALDELTSTLSSALNQTTDRVREMSPSADELKGMTTDEVNKLFAFEYRVQELPVTSTASEIERAIAALGDERWECFDVESRKETLLIFCKRRPQTYLRYIPRVFP